MKYLGRVLKGKFGCFRFLGASQKESRLTFKMLKESSILKLVLCLILLFIINFINNNKYYHHHYHLKTKLFPL